MATLKQKKAHKLSVENHGNVSKSMKEAGYTEASAKNPKNLTESKGWAELMEEAFPDDLLTKVHTEGLEATKINSSHTEPDYAVPDFAIRHKYLETAYKIKGKLVDKAQIDGKLEVTLTRES